MDLEKLSRRKVACKHVRLFDLLNAIYAVVLILFAKCFVMWHNFPISSENEYSSPIAYFARHNGKWMRNQFIKLFDLKKTTKLVNFKMLKF